MRGKEHWHYGAQRRTGITPAHAGKRCRPTGQCRARGDHPRTCGEKLSRLKWAALCQGSPPHMRGKAFITDEVLDSVRITPAHAGKSIGMEERRNAEKDHPRTCGEKHNFRKHNLICPGSPPHMRGKAGLHTDPHNERRITPAHAGKSLLNLSSTLWIQGSPPHMRGKEQEVLQVALLRRITPAHAGKSLTLLMVLMTV